MPAWSVDTRLALAPSRHCRDARRVYGHTTTAIHNMSNLPASPTKKYVLKAKNHFFDWWCTNKKDKNDVHRLEARLQNGGGGIIKNWQVYRFLFLMAGKHINTHREQRTRTKKNTKIAHHASGTKHVPWRERGHTHIFLFISFFWKSQLCRQVKYVQSNTVQTQGCHHHQQGVASYMK